MKLNVENRKIVVPGEILGTGDFLLGEGIFKSGENVCSNILGLVDVKESFIKVIPLSGKYTPKNRDVIIGIVTDVAFSAWYVDLNSHYSGVLSIANATERFIDVGEEDISDIFGIGDVVVAKVINVSGSMVAGLTMKDANLMKLQEGRLIKVDPTKVPRIIGKKGTMINLLKEHTGCRIVVGQNGRVWVNGTNPILAIDAIRMIEKQAHTPGLTEKMNEYLKNKTKTVNKKEDTAPSLKPRKVAEKEKPVGNIEKPASSTEKDAKKPVSATVKNEAKPKEVAK